MDVAQPIAVVPEPAPSPRKIGRYVLFALLTVFVVALAYIYYHNRSVAVQLIDSKTGEGVANAQVSIDSQVICEGPCGLEYYYGKSDQEGFIFIRHDILENFKGGGPSWLSRLINRANAQPITGDTTTYQITVTLNEGNNKEKTIFGLGGTKVFEDNLFILDNNTIKVGPFRLDTGGGYGEAVAFDFDTELPIKQQPVYAVEERSCIPTACSRYISLGKTGDDGVFVLPSAIKEYWGDRYIYIQGYGVSELPSMADFYKTGDFTRVVFFPVK